VQIDHINIRAPSELLEQERRFFCEVLELRDGPRPDFPSKGYWLYADDHPIVHLSQGGPLLPDGRSGYIDHVAFRSSGLQSLIQRLQDATIGYSTNYLSELRMTQVFLKSPSATGIEVNFIDETI
jgi:catechol 2,3-dioxygenase-like lactoylglutathione lyase family enzyme